MPNYGLLILGAAENMCLKSSRRALVLRRLEWHR